MDKNIVVFGKTYKSACVFLDNLVNDIRFGDVMKYKKHPRMEVLLKNGDKYLAIIADDSARGLKCDKAYVDVEINEDTINKVIRTSLTLVGNIEFFNLR